MVRLQEIQETLEFNEEALIVRNDVSTVLRSITAGCIIIVVNAPLPPFHRLNIAETLNYYCYETTRNGNNKLIRGEVITMNSLGWKRTYIYIYIYSRRREDLA